MFCKHCGAQICDEAVICVNCGCKVISPKSAAAIDRNDAALRMVVPIGCSGWAIVAGYLGLLSLLPVFGVAACVFGLLALNDIKKHPDKHGKGRAWFGIIMGGITTPLYLFIFIIVGFA